MQNNLMNIIEYIIRNGGAWWSTHYVRRSQKSEAQLWSIIFSFVGVHHFGVNCGRVSRIERYLDIYIYVVESLQRQALEWRVIAACLFLSQKIKWFEP